MGEEKVRVAEKDVRGRGMELSDPEEKLRDGGEW